MERELQNCCCPAPAGLHRAEFRGDSGDRSRQVLPASFLLQCSPGAQGQEQEREQVPAQPPPTTLDEAAQEQWDSNSGSSSRQVFPVPSCVPRGVSGEDKKGNGRKGGMPPTQVEREGGKSGKDSYLIGEFEKVPACISYNIICSRGEARSRRCSHLCCAGHCFHILLLKILDPPTMAYVTLA